VSERGPLRSSSQSRLQDRRWIPMSTISCVPQGLIRRFSATMRTHPQLDSRTQRTHITTPWREKTTHTSIFTWQEFHEPMPEWSSLRLRQSQKGNMFPPQPSNGHPRIFTFKLSRLYSHKQSDQRKKLLSIQQFRCGGHWNRDRLQCLGFLSRCSVLFFLGSVSLALHGRITIRCSFTTVPNGNRWLGDVAAAVYQNTNLPGFS